MNQIIKVPLVFVENWLLGSNQKLRSAVEKMIFNPYFFGKKHSDYTGVQYKKFLDDISVWGGISGKVLLELGPGGSLEFGILALKDGLKHYFAIDKGIHARVLGESKKITYIDIGSNGSYSLDNESVDIIYSCAVLEHVFEVDSVFKEMVRVLKKGGVMNHQVDLRDHLFDQKSLDFLKINESLFKFLCGNSGEYVNRKRISYYRDLYKKYDLKILREDINIRYEGALDEKLLKKYNENDLVSLSFNVVLKK